MLPCRPTPVATADASITTTMACFFLEAFSSVAKCEGRVSRCPSPHRCRPPDYSRRLSAISTGYASTRCLGAVVMWHLGKPELPFVQA